MNTWPKKSIEQRGSCGWGIQVDFEYSTDRWSHQIGWFGPDQSMQTLLRSVEGTFTDRWPPSPPFQEIVIGSAKTNDKANSGSCHSTAMTLGRAGSSHWSASFVLTADPLQLTVDVAVRVGESPEFLGSTYQCGIPELSVQRREDLMELARYASAKILLMPFGDDDCLFQKTSDRLVVRPSEKSKNATRRWRYAIAVENISHVAGESNKKGRS